MIWWCRSDPINFLMPYSQIADLTLTLCIFYCFFYYLAHVTGRSMLGSVSPFIHPDRVWSYFLGWGYNEDVQMCRCHNGYNADSDTGKHPHFTHITKSRVFTKPYEACIQGCLDFNVQSSRVSAVAFWFTIISLYRPPGPLEAYSLWSQRRLTVAARGSNYRTTHSTTYTSWHMTATSYTALLRTRTSQSSAIIQILPKCSPVCCLHPLTTTSPLSP